MIVDTYLRRRANQLRQDPTAKVSLSEQIDVASDLKAAIAHALLAVEISAKFVPSSITPCQAASWSSATDKFLLAANSMLHEAEELYKVLKGYQEAQSDKP